MKLKCYAIRDRQIASFMTPIFFFQDGQAIRFFTDEVNRDAPDNLLYRHASDYDLYSLGVFDTDTGLFSTDNPQQIAVGKSVSIRSNS